MRSKTSLYGKQRTRGAEGGGAHPARMVSVPLPLPATRMGWSESWFSRSSLTMSIAEAASDIMQQSSTFSGEHDGGRLCNVSNRLPHCPQALLLPGGSRATFDKSPVRPPPFLQGIGGARAPL